MPSTPEQPQVPLLTLAEAAERLGVHPDTMGRWVRRGELPGYKLGSVVRVRHDDLEEYLGRRRLAPAATSAPGPDRRAWAQARQRLHFDLLEGDLAGAMRIVDRLLDDGATVGEVHLRLLTLVVRRLGVEHDRGVVGLGVQRRAIEAVRMLMTHAAPRLVVAPVAQPGTAVVATLPGERHDLGLTMLVDFVASVGWRVHRLGTEVPGSAVADVARLTDADLVCLSTQVPPDAHELEPLAAHRVVIGGPGVDVAQPGQPHVTVMHSLQRLRERLAAADLPAGRG